MDWSAIANEAAAALAEVGFSATLTRVTWGAETPWGGAAGTVETFALTVVDGGIKTSYIRAGDGTLIPRTARELTVAADGVSPQMGDRVMLPDGEHEISAVMPTSPGGVDLLFKIHVAI